MLKQIHVNSYVKRDGTQVREHFRSIDTDNYRIPPIVPETDIPPMDYPSQKPVVMYEAPVLKGGVSVDVGIPSSGPSVGDVLGGIGSIAVNVLPLVLEIIQASKGGNVQMVNNLIPQFDTKIKQLDNHVAQMKTNIDNNVAKLVNAKNQVEYSNLYKTLQSNYQVYQRASNLANRIKVHANNGNYQAVANELGNYTQNWDNKGNIYYTNHNNQPVNIQNANRFKNQLKALGNNTKNWINETNPNSSAYKQKMYLAGLAASAPLNLGSAATAKIGQSLTPILGQRIAQLSAQGLSSGVASGAVSGLGRGVIYGQNPFLTSIQDAALFGSMGGLTNLGLGSLEKAIAQYQIYQSPIKEILINNYIKNYVEGLENFKKEIDNIRAMRAGSPPLGRTGQILHDTEPLKYTGKYVKIDGKSYPEIWMPKEEYAHVIHEINSNISNREKQIGILYRYIGNYKYKFIYVNFNKYIFVGKEIIK